MTQSWTARSLLGASLRTLLFDAWVTDPLWIEEVLKSPGPYFPAAEAVLIHLEERQVRSVFEMIAERLPGALLALETAGLRLADSCAFDRLPARWPAGSARPTA
ncbi:hypothetical protein [Streptomyces curacoi]|uniref:Uncharacterized protein n=1 Tax=Streptomyces curacoi TaxID=146536 RepID=A0A117NYU5_9ACTN|nr:hypothetical protein [Streptomyces curacoi]KUM69953.1 hypothetical protein AQI70_30420 [Streptomyces curacoi]